MLRRGSRGNRALASLPDALHTRARLCKVAAVSSPRPTSNLLTLLGIACLAATLGCASATLDVVSPVPIPIEQVSIALLDDTGGDLTPEQLRSFKRVVTRALLGSGIEVLPAPSSRSGAPRVVGSVVRHDPGIRALRFVSRYGLGTGGLETVWDVKDARSTTIARCRIDGSVSMGTFGGSFEDVEEETGKALARFLRGDIR